MDFVSIIAHTALLSGINYKNLTKDCMLRIINLVQMIVSYVINMQITLMKYCQALAFAQQKCFIAYILKP